VVAKDPEDQRAAKIGLTNQRNLAGLGIWALGYDRGEPGYWDAVASAYAAPKVTSVAVIPAAPPPGAIPTPGMTNSPNVLVNTAWQESASAVRYSAGWRKVASINALGGTLRYSTLTGSTATFRFTGSAIGFVGPLGPARGVAKVLIDGVAAGAINEYAKLGRSRQVVYSRTVAPGAHTVTIKLVGTAGHPRVDRDAFVVLN